MNEERESVQKGDEVMFRGIKERYLDPFNTPEVGEKGIVTGRALLQNGVFGWAVKWYRFGKMIVSEDIISVTKKYAALPFKVGDTVVLKNDIRIASAGTFGKVVDITETFYGVAFENCKMWYCSEKEIAKPTPSETNLHNEIIRLRGLFKCQK